MMKKRSILIVVLLVCASLTSVFAEDGPVWWGSMYKPGNVSLSGALGFESDS